MSAESKNIRILKAGDVLFHEGDQGDHIYLVKEGEVDIVKNVGAKNEAILSTVGQGEFIGEMAVLEDLARAASARAKTAATLQVLDRTAFMSQVTKDPHAALVVMRALSNRLRKSSVGSKMPRNRRPQPKADQSDEEYVAFTSESFSAQTTIAAFSFVIIIVSALVVMMLVEVETTVSAYAKVVPKTPNLIVESSVEGSLKDVKVKEGQVVSQGQVVAVLDTSIIDAEVKAVQSELNRIKARYLRLVKEKQVISSGAGAVNTEMEKLSGRSDFVLKLKSRLKKRQTSLSVFDKKIVAAEQALDAAQKEVSSINVEYGLVKDQLKMLKASRSISRMEQIDKEAALARTKNKLSEKNTAVVEAKGKIEVIQAEKSAFVSDWNDDLEVQLEQDKMAVEELEIKLERLKVEQENHIIRSTVDGRVLDLLVHREGTVLSKGHPVADITRSNQELVVMAEVPSKDVGALVEGLPVSFKLDSLPFQRYGDIAGTVVRVDEDSVESSRPGVNDEFYMVRVFLDDQRTTKAPKGFVLKRGMIGRADLITGKRSILSYLLDPIVGSMKTAFKEGA